MPTFTPFEGPYSNHCDITLNPGTGVAEITVTYRANNAGAYRCQLFELAPPYTGKPLIKRDWAQGPDYGVNGPFGYGASQVLPNGALLVAIPAGLENANSVTPTIYMEPNYAAPYALGTGSADPALTPRVAQLEQTAAAQAAEIAELRTMLGNLTGGVLSPADVQAIEWVKSLRRLITIGVA